MATDLAWIHSWLVIVLTMSSVLALLFLVFSCICWQRKKLPQFNALEASGLNKGKSINSFSSLALFRRFSVTNKHNEESGFSSKNLPIFNKSKNPESAVMDSVEVSKSFDNLILQFEQNSLPEAPSRDELQSCASTDSTNTFYSVHTNLKKSNSFVSVISDSSELDNFFSCMTLFHLSKNTLNSIHHDT